MYRVQGNLPISLVIAIKATRYNFKQHFKQHYFDCIIDRYAFIFIFIDVMQHHNQNLVLDFTLPSASFLPSFSSVSLSSSLILLALSTSSS